MADAKAMKTFNPFQIKHSGIVAACGLAGGMELKGATVAPFILRGVTLRGVDSVFQNMETRHSIYIRTVSSERLLSAELV